MKELLVGLDICDSYTKAFCAEAESVLHVPTVVCKKKQEDVWMIGQEAYASALEGEGVMVDKLLKLLTRGGTSTIGGVRYEASELMVHFLECVLARLIGQAGAESAVPAAGDGTSEVRDDAPGVGDGVPAAGDGVPEAGGGISEVRDGAPGAGDGVPEAGDGAPEAKGSVPDAGDDTSEVRDGAPDAGNTGAPDAGNAGSSDALPAYDSARIRQLVITVPRVGASLLDSLVYCADGLGIPRDRVHIISHTESFLYYVLSQKREVWNNQVGMFDLSRDFLGYYEMKVQRGMRQTAVYAEREKLDEGFDLDILSSPSTMKLADKILCACGERFLQKKLFSSVFLTGEGFDSQEWAPEFMKLVCARRKVYAEQALFVKGAAFKAADQVREKTQYPYIFICDGRLDTTVSIKVQHNDQESQLVLASAGDSWYEARTALEVILDHQQYIDFLISPPDPKKRKTVRLTLEGFPEREDKTLRVEIRVAFLDGNTMAVAVKDVGFGDFYPSSGASVRQEVML